MTNCTWANNIFYNDQSAIFSGSTNGQSFSGNIYQGTIGLSIPSGMNNINPLLVLNSDGYYGLSATSPAIDASLSYPSLLIIPSINDVSTIEYDIQGQTRPVSIALKDVGCDEFTTGASINHPLHNNDVGPSYLITPILSSGDGIQNKETIAIYPNPSTGLFYVNATNQMSTVLITNILGETILSKQIKTNKVELDLSNVEKGVYFYQIKYYSGLMTSGKLIKQ